MALARPGPLWGPYPQREQTATLEPRAGRLDCQRIARDADALRRTAATPACAINTRAAVATTLARQGLNAASIVPALSLAATAMADVLRVIAEPTQLYCAALLLNGQLAQMDTGEGKTYAAALAAAVAGLGGAPVHVLTANDYLAERDQQRLHDYFAALGLDSGFAGERCSDEQRRAAYRRRITYATARGVAFDYLRDRVALAAEGSAGPAVARAGTDDRSNPSLLNGLCFALVDEADSVLIDEASVPLILAEQQHDPELRARAWRAIDLARRLGHADTSAGIDDLLYADPAEPRQPRLTARGRQCVAQWSAAYGSAWRNELFRIEAVELALRALAYPAARRRLPGA